MVDVRPTPLFETIKTKVDEEGHDKTGKALPTSLLRHNELHLITLGIPHYVREFVRELIYVKAPRKANKEFFQSGMASFCFSSVYIETSYIVFKSFRFQNSFI